MVDILFTPFQLLLQLNLRILIIIMQVVIIRN